MREYAFELKIFEGKPGVERCDSGLPRRNTRIPYEKVINIIDQGRQLGLHREMPAMQ